jgi:predicted RNA binding protein YcfA (HicA-like mRNA interferase family)/predicted RNase H-like HicB family nuclease
MTTLTAYIEFDEETGLYVGIVPGIPGAHSQAASLDELRANLQEVLELCLEEQADLRERLPKFVGVQQIEVAWVPRLVPVDARVMERVLQRLGFARVRQKGSHVFYRHPDGRTTTVPHHKGHDLAVSLVRAILTDIGLSPAEFLRLLKS